MVETGIVEEQRSFMPWLIGLALAVLLVIGMTLVFADDTRATGETVPDIGKAHEKKKDATPRHLQQWADHVPGTPQAVPARAA